MSYFILIFYLRTAIDHGIRCEGLGDYFTLCSSNVVCQSRKDNNWCLFFSESVYVYDYYYILFHYIQEEAVVVEKAGDIAYLVYMYRVQRVSYLAELESDEYWL